MAIAVSIVADVNPSVVIVTAHEVTVPAHVAVGFVAPTPTPPFPPPGIDCKL